MEFLGGHCHILMTALLQTEFEIVSKVRLACKYFKPRKYNEILVIYLLSERAVSCPLPRSIFMIKVFVQARVHVPVRSAMFVIAFSNLSILIRNLSVLHVKPLMEEMLSSSGWPCIYVAFPCTEYAVPLILLWNFAQLSHNIITNTLSYLYGKL